MNFNWHSEAIILVDLAIPGARNSLVLPKIAQAVSNLCQVCGPENAVVIIHSPSRSKEESSTDPSQDELDFTNMLWKQKMTTPCRFVQILEVPAAELLGHDWSILMLMICFWLISMLMNMMWQSLSLDLNDDTVTPETLPWRQRNIPSIRNEVSHANCNFTLKGGSPNRRVLAQGHTATQGPKP